MSGDDSKKPDSLFAELQQGVSITAGLKKVDRKALKEKMKDMPPVEQKEVKPAATAVKAKRPANSKVDGDSQKTLVKSTHTCVVENFGGTSSERIRETLACPQTKHLVILNCELADFTIDNELETLTIDNCKRLRIQYNCKSDSQHLEIFIFNSDTINGQTCHSVPKSISASYSSDVVFDIPHIEKQIRELEFYQCASNNFSVDFDVDGEQSNLLFPPYTSISVVDNKLLVEGDKITL
ncbi:MAG: suppressor of rasval19 [Marteilia pararefringens]